MKLSELDPKKLYGVPGFMTEEWVEAFGAEVAYFVALPICFPARKFGLRDDIFWSYFGGFKEESDAEAEFMKVKKENMPVRGVIRVSRLGARFVLNNGDAETCFWPVSQAEDFGSW